MNDQGLQQQEISAAAPHFSLWYMVCECLNSNVTASSLGEF